MKRITFVGKDQSNHSSFAETISDLPVEVVWAAGGREALALLEDHDVVAVVIDVATLATDELESNRLGP